MARMRVGGCREVAEKWQRAYPDSFSQSQGLKKRERGAASGQDESQLIWASQLPRVSQSG